MGTADAINVDNLRANVVEIVPRARSASNPLLNAILKNHIVRNGMADTTAFSFMLK